MTDETVKYITMNIDWLKYFRETYVADNQFGTRIGDIVYVFNLDAYDATTVYKPFFYYEVADGIMLTSANPKYGNINLFIELGPEIHVNYYFKFSVTDGGHLVDLNRSEWIEWFSLLAYVLGSRSVVIHSNYVITYNKEDDIATKQMKTRYTYSQNVSISIFPRKQNCLTSLWK